MQVILRQDIENLGKIGEVVNVKNGYARNYLIPRSYAYVATAGALKAVESEKKKWAKKQEQIRAEAMVLAEKLAGETVEIPMKIGDESSKTFGSVTNQMIAEGLAKLGYNIDKRNVQIDTPIKSLGHFEVSVKLHTDVIANVKIYVSQDDK